MKLIRHDDWIVLVDAACDGQPEGYLREWHRVRDAISTRSSIQLSSIALRTVADGWLLWRPGHSDGPGSDTAGGVAWISHEDAAQLADQIRWHAIWTDNHIQPRSTK